MLVAGEPSGDMLAAELVSALRASETLSRNVFPPEFFGAGGPRMAAAGVDLAIDLTEHAVFGISDVLAQYFKFRRIFEKLFRLALDRLPDVVILVDFSGFNRRFASAIKGYARHRAGSFINWQPKMVYYVSPQVWASREYRAYQLARDVDLLLSIFPFEKAWYGSRVPQLRVEFVGHPIIDRYASAGRGPSSGPRPKPPPQPALGGSSVVGNVSTDKLRITDFASHPSLAPLVLLLPGSRKREIEAHLPVMIEAFLQMRARQSVRSRLVLPTPESRDFARRIAGPDFDSEIQSGGLDSALAEADLAIASSGTVTLECAYFRVPTVVLYKTSWLTYRIARQIVQVKYIAMPNILAGERVFPEFIQNEATPENIRREAIDLLNNLLRRAAVKDKLAKVIQALGETGASQRAAQAVLSELPKRAEP